MRTEIQSIEDFHALLEKSKKTPVLLFKYSTRCPVSAKAQWEFENFCKLYENTSALAQMNVITQRELSREIAKLVAVQHESPQAILFHNEKAVWNKSHGSITESTLKSAFENIKS